MNCYYNGILDNYYEKSEQFYFHQKYNSKNLQCSGDFRKDTVKAFGMNEITSAKINTNNRELSFNKHKKYSDNRKGDRDELCYQNNLNDKLRESVLEDKFPLILSSKNVDVKLSG